MELKASRQALENSRLSVRALRASRFPENFLSQLPAILASLDVVTSRIDRESEGHRMPAFVSWWSELRTHPLHVELHRLRNLALKDGAQVVEVEWLPPPRPRPRANNSSRVTGLFPPSVELEPHYLFADPTMTERDVVRFLTSCLEWLTETLAQAERLIG
jgi:hypothetical protein